MLNTSIKKENEVTALPQNHVKEHRAQKTSIYFPQAHEGLKSFLTQWDKNYLEKVRKIPIFDSHQTKNWNELQKIYFTKIFYHARGHFHDFLWFMGNHATDKDTKELVLQNISEELGGSANSHEQLYLFFAKEIGVDLYDEFINDENYLPFLREFNKGHLKWLKENDQECRLATFSAYERLDNVDYVNLLKLAESLNVNRKGLLFFKVHTRVQHFETTLEILNEVWDNQPEKVIGAFNFIAAHQIQMWENLSAAVFKDTSH